MCIPSWPCIPVPYEPTILEKLSSWVCFEFFQPLFYFFSLFLVWSDIAPLWDGNCICENVVSLLKFSISCLFQAEKCIIYISLTKSFKFLRFFILKAWHEVLKFFHYQFLPIFTLLQARSTIYLFAEQMKVSNFIQCTSFFAEILLPIFIVVPKNRLMCLYLDSMQLLAGRYIISWLAPIFSIRAFTSCCSFISDDRKVFKVHFSWNLSFVLWFIWIFS
jgi:hypothetical protein